MTAGAGHSANGDAQFGELSAIPATFVHDFPSAARTSLWNGLEHDIRKSIPKKNSRCAVPGVAGDRHKQCRVCVQQRPGQRARAAALPHPAPPRCPPAGL